MAITINSYSEANQNNFTQLGSGAYTDAGNNQVNIGTNNTSLTANKQICN